MISKQGRIAKQRKVKKVTWAALAQKTIFQMALMLIGIGFTCYASLNAIQVTTKHQDLAEKLTAQYGKNLEQALFQTSDQFARLIQDTLVTTGLSDLNQSIAAIKAQAPSVQAVYLVEPGQVDPKPHQKKLGYAAIEMAKRAFKGHIVPPEVHQFADNKAYIEHVFPLSQGQEVSAVAVVIEDMQFFEGFFNHYTHVPGYLVLRETSLGQNRFLADNKMAESGHWGAHAKTQIAGTTWSLNFWLDKSYGFYFKEGLPLLVLSMLCLIVGVGAVIWRNYQYLQQLVIADKEKLETMLQHYSKARHEHLQFHFRFANQLSKYIKHLNTKR